MSFITDLHPGSISAPGTPETTRSQLPPELAVKATQNVDLKQMGKGFLAGLAQLAGIPGDLFGGMVNPDRGDYEKGHPLNEKAALGGQDLISRAGLEGEGKDYGFGRMSVDALASLVGLGAVGSGSKVSAISRLGPGAKQSGSIGVNVGRLSPKEVAAAKADPEQFFKETQTFIHPMMEGNRGQKILNIPDQAFADALKYANEKGIVSLGETALAKTEIGKIPRANDTIISTGSSRNSFTRGDKGEPGLIDLSPTAGPDVLGHEVNHLGQYLTGLPGGGNPERIGDLRAIARSLNVPEDILQEILGHSNYGAYRNLAGEFDSNRVSSILRGEMGKDVLPFSPKAFQVNKEAISSDVLNMIAQDGGLQTAFDQAKRVRADIPNTVDDLSILAGSRGKHVPIPMRLLEGKKGKVVPDKLGDGLDVTAPSSLINLFLSP